MAYKKLKYWFDRALADDLGEKIKLVKDDFSANAFSDAVDQVIKNLELKPRVKAIADLLHQFLGDDYSANAAILIQILGPENEEETGMFTNYYWIMPIAKYVEDYGLGHFEESMQAIAEITKRNTGEYAIRPYFTTAYEATLAQMKVWSTNKNKHIRRLSCEGLRPRLPWASKLQIFIDDPRPILPILTQLKDDKAKYVQNSVANCINDILKDNFDVGKELIESWLKNATPERKWIIKHAIRNWRKKEDAWAMSVMEKIETMRPP